MGSGGGGNEIPITKSGLGFTATYEIPTAYEGGEQTGTGLQSLPVVPGDGYAFATYPAAGCDLLFTVLRNPQSGPLSVSISSPPATQVGLNLTYAITVTNLGKTPLFGVSATLPLPVEWTDQYSRNCEGQGPTFTCVFGDTVNGALPGPDSQLLPGESQTASVTGTVETGTVFPIVATVTATGKTHSATVTASAETTTPEAPPSMQTHNPTVTVNPSTDLSNAQLVEVDVTGFGQGTKFYLSECATATDANSAGCGQGLPMQPFGLTDDTGTGSLSFAVTSTAATGPQTSTTPPSIPCMNKCVIVATLGIGLGYASAPISFSP